MKNSLAKRYSVYTTMNFKKNIKSYLKEILRKVKEPGFKELIISLRPKLTDKELIRLGGNADGGYLVPDDLKNIGACFSAGVGDVCNFESDCANLGMQVFMADASVDAPAIQDPRFNFIKKFIGGKNKEDL